MNSQPKFSCRQVLDVLEVLSSMLAFWTKNRATLDVCLSAQPRACLERRYSELLKKRVKGGREQAREPFPHAHFLQAVECGPLGFLSSLGFHLMNPVT